MTSIPAQYAGLVDDAATYPPGNASLEDAAAAWRGRRGSPAAALVGAFVVPDHRLGELDRLLAEPTPVTVVLAQGAGGVAPVAGNVARLDHLRLAGLEVALRDPDDLAANARRVVAAVDQARADEVLDDDVPVYVELPGGDPTAGWLAAADELAMAELRLKFRTGGVEPDLFPDADRLATWIDAALDRETPFKCTAGLHNAVRHSDPETGFEHHGFVNVLAATRAALDGGDVRAVLEERDGEALVAGLPDADTLLRTRTWFGSFGSCSVTEPLDDLHALGLLAAGEASA